MGVKVDTAVMYLGTHLSEQDPENRVKSQIHLNVLD